MSLGLRSWTDKPGGNVSQSLCPFFILDHVDVQVSAASHLELNISLVLHLDRFGIFPSGCKQEILEPVYI